MNLPKGQTYPLQTRVLLRVLLWPLGKFVIIGPPGNTRHFTNSSNIGEKYRDVHVAAYFLFLTYHVLEELIDEINDEPVNFEFTKLRGSFGVKF